MTNIYSFQLAAVSSLIQSAASKTISDTPQAAHQRLSRAVHQQWASKGKLWTRYGNKVWSEPIRIGFHNYTDIYSREDQDAILKECTDVSGGHVDVGVVFFFIGNSQ